MPASKPSGPEQVESTKSTLPDSCVLYKGEKWKISAAVNDLIITDKSGRHLLAPIARDDILKLVNLETGHEKELSGAEISAGFHKGVLELLDGAKKISATRHKLKENGTNKKDISNSITEEETKKSFEKEKSTWVCPFCGTDLTMVVEKEKKSRSLRILAKTLRCPECGQKIKVSRSKIMPG